MTPLSGISNEARIQALDRFKIIRPFVEDGVPLAQIAREHGISLRTVQYWVLRYRTDGLAGLSRKERDDKEKRKLEPWVEQLIEGLALSKPRLSTSAIHRKAAEEATKRGHAVPSYKVVRSVVGSLKEPLVTLAHEGSKAYSASFDLVHRHEAARPNAVWQADHTELDILVKDAKGKARRPWLTVVLDDYSRATAAYFVSFSAPSAAQTALALRQAIWRKQQPGWHVCGIPQVLYTDHGSDFTSQHIEQVAADLKIRLVFSAAGRPRGRGKIERFFSSLAQVLLSRLPGYAREPELRKAVLTLPELTNAIERYLIDEYMATPHSETREAPQARWEAGGFLPQMPDSLERLDLLLLTVAKARRVHQDGVRFAGHRYIDPTLAAYVGEEVVLRYDPRDVAEVRLFHGDKFLCRAVCQELAGATVPLREIIRARNRRRGELRQTIEERRSLVDALLEAKRWQSGESAPEPMPSAPPVTAVKLRRYACDE